MNDERFSDELLNAYVDGELDMEDRRRIEHAMRRDSHLRERVNELEMLKGLVAGAYVSEAPAPRRRRLPGRWNPGALAASVAAFALGVFLTWGWLAYYGGAPLSPLASAPAGDDGAAMEAQGAVKVVFHLSRDDPERLDAILDEAEALLATTGRRGQPVAVRVIASGGGLLRFEERAATQAARIRALKDTYQEQLVFNGCGVAYKQFKKLRPEAEFDLLPEVKLVDLGVLELMRRQRQGWAYVRI